MRVLYLADWQHPDRLEPFLLASVPDGGTAFAVTLRTDAHFVDAMPPAQRTAAHNSMLRAARWRAVDAFTGAAHRLVLDCTRASDGTLHAHGAYALRTQANGVPEFADVLAMPDELIDGAPRPLLRRVGDAFERWSGGRWQPHLSDHVRHQLVMEARA